MWPVETWGHLSYPRHIGPPFLWHIGPPFEGKIWHIGPPLNPYIFADSYYR